VANTICWRRAQGQSAGKLCEKSVAFDVKMWYTVDGTRPGRAIAGHECGTRKVRAPQSAMLGNAQAG
jgi:hypothetical protein